MSSTFSSVEWVIHKNGDAYTLGTIHDSYNAGSWEDYGLEQPDASVHSHPGVQTSANNEIESMGYWSEGVAKGSDWDNVVNDVNTNVYLKLYWNDQCVYDFIRVQPGFTVDDVKKRFHRNEDYVLYEDNWYVHKECKE